MSQTLDLTQIRSETPGVKERLHFNNAGAGLMPQAVLDAQLDYLQVEVLNGGYETAAMMADKIENSYSAIARLINAKPDEIAVVENATVAWAQVFFGFPFKQGDRILTAESEYASNYIAFLQVKKRLGIEIDVAPSDESGQVDCEKLAAMIGPKTAMICLSHIPTNGGLIQPAEKVGEIAQAHNIPYLLDACQSVGQLHLDVTKLKCDFLSATGRKYMRGPRGTGFLYVRRAALDLLEPAVLDLHSAKWTGPYSYTMRDDARRFENWENNLAAKVGLGVAADYAHGLGTEATEQRLVTLATSLRNKLSAVKGIEVFDLGKRKGGITTFTKTGSDPFKMMATLREQSINTSVSDRESTLLDADRRGLAPMLRASVHYYNSEEEVDRFVDAVESL